LVHTVKGKFKERWAEYFEMTLNAENPRKILSDGISNLETTPKIRREEVEK